MTLELCFGSIASGIQIRVGFSTQLHLDEEKKSLPPYKGVVKMWIVFHLRHHCGTVSSLRRSQFLFSTFLNCLSIIGHYIEADYSRPQRPGSVSGTYSCVVQFYSKISSQET